MNVDRHAELPCLTSDLLEEVVLERLVLDARRSTARCVPCINPSRVSGKGVSEVEWSQVRCLELQGNGASPPLSLDRGPHDTRDILVERRWQPDDVQVAHVATQERLLFRI